MNLFQKTDIAEISDEKAIRLTISNLEREDVWLISIAGQVSPNYQILYSLGAKVFINAFNNRLGKFSLNGIYIPETCDGKSEGSVPPFLKFYKDVQITKKKSTTITYDGVSIKGWAVSMTLRNYSKNNIDGHEFTIEFLGRIRELEE